MSLIIPDIIIANTLNSALQAVRNNYLDCIDQGIEEQSWLYLLFSGLSLGGYNYYTNAIELIITTPQDPKHLSVVLSYVHNTGDPTTKMYVALSSENNRNDSLGIGQGNQDELVFEEQRLDQYNRRFATTYQLYIVGENKAQISVLYNLMRALIIACIGHFELSSLLNFKIGGQDLKFQTVVPDRLFSRAITMNFEYEAIVPDIVKVNIYRKISLYYKPQGADTAQGPIAIELDDESDSSL